MGLAAFRARRGEVLRQQIDRIPAPTPEQFLLATAEVLLEFIYETVELGRRRALSEMLIPIEIVFNWFEELLERLGN